MTGLDTVVPVLRELTPLIRSSNVASELPAARWISEEEIRLLTAPPPSFWAAFSFRPLPLFPDALR